MINFDDSNNDILKGYSMLLYFAGSFILNEPMESCIKDLETGNIFRKMPVSSNNPNFLLASSFLNNINSDNATDYDEILADNLTLFGSSGKAQAPPYESKYLLTNSPITINSEKEVRHIYQTYAWAPAIEEGIPGDHLGIELLFLNLLLEKFREIDDGACHKELSKDIRKFIDNHLSKWIIEWNRDIQKYAISDFYKGIGYLVVACTQDVYYLV